MSAAQSTNGGDEEQDTEITKQEFFDRLPVEGVTIDGGFYMPRGTGRARRYFKYNPYEVKGFDAVRDDDGEIVCQEVANHDEAVVDKTTKSHLEDIVYEKVSDGFGVMGLSEPPSRDDESEDDTDADEVIEKPVLSDDGLAETIRDNFDEHGFFAENEDGDTKVVSLASPDARLIGYITGSHIKSLPANIGSVDEYRRAVYQVLVVEADGPEESAGIESPDQVPIATDDMMETFKESGNKVRDDQELRDKLARQVKARWDDGSYNHLRAEEDADDED